MTTQHMPCSMPSSRDPNTPSIHSRLHARHSSRLSHAASARSQSSGAGHILVIGAGVAGCSTALKLASYPSLRDKTITLLSGASADPLTSSNSYWAQGGIIYQASEVSAAEDAIALSHDILTAGVFLNDVTAVHKVVTEGPCAVRDLLMAPGSAHPVPFETVNNTLNTLNDIEDIEDSNHSILPTEQPPFALTLEAGHSAPRILYQADYTGKAIMTSLMAAVHATPAITLVAEASVLELLLNESEECIGATVLDHRSSTTSMFLADTTILATGGLGGLYQNTTNPSHAIGSGLSLGITAGAETDALAFMQFHPTTLYDPNSHDRFLLTEALRGEGGRLRDATGRAFAIDYHPSGELAPRDVVARMILAEMTRQEVAHMYLDMSHHSSAYLSQRFPTVWAKLEEAGLDMSHDLVPIVPAAHYHCGGLVTDLTGATSIPYLFAAGEVACTGLHGANRLASTSLLEGLVFGSEIAATLAREASELNSTSLNDDVVIEREWIPMPSSFSSSCVEADKTLVPLHETDSGCQQSVKAYWSRLRALMWQYVGPVRSTRGLEKGLDQLSCLAAEVMSDALLVDRGGEKENVTIVEVVALHHALVTSHAIATDALERTTSVGTHYLETREECEECDAGKNEPRATRVEESEKVYL